MDRPPGALRAAHARLTAAMLICIGIFGWLADPAAAFTNDTYFTRECKGSQGCSFQWGLDRVGAEYAWDVSEGSGVLIGVIDSGIDLEHPDLTAQLIQGADFVGGDSTPTDNDPDDEHGHGTLVAGISAASTGNGAGIASVARKAKLLPVRVFGNDGTAQAADVVQGIRYAVEKANDLNMALVLNLSFEAGEDEGSADPLSLLLSTPEVDSAIKDAARAGAAVVIAAGNENRDRTSYDAPDSSGIVVVGASDQNDLRAGFSNYGVGLDLVAPGTDITSTYWKQENDTAAYAIAAGTSMSVPFVAGTAAMLMARGRNNIDAIARILGTAQDLGPAGRDNDTGYGLLDTAAALGAERPQPVPTSTKARPSPSPSPSPSPAPLVLPSPGSPPPVVQEVSVPSPIEATGTVQGSDDTLPGPDVPLRPIAAGLLGLVSVMHVVRKVLLT